MTRIILYEILRVVILNLLYTSMYSVGGSLYPEFNPLVGEPFNLVCRIEATTITSTVIRFPNGIDAGYCDPPSDRIPADCGGFGNYSSALNETEKTVTISTNSLASDVNGTWTCKDSTDTFLYNLVAPIREIKDDSITFFPPSFTGNITSETASISLSATYGCINLPVYFKWFVVDSASTKIDISGTSNVAENSSVCTFGFSEYTETKEVNEDVYSSSSVMNLNGRYRIGVEVHYTDEVTTLHSIKYFDTYLVFNPTTTTEQQTTTHETTTHETTTDETNETITDETTTHETTTDETTTMKTNVRSIDIVILIIIVVVSATFGLIIIITIIVYVIRRKTNTKNRRNQPVNNSGNPPCASKPVDNDRKNDRKAKEKNMCV